MQIAIYTYLLINLLSFLYGIAYEYHTDKRYRNGFEELIEDHGWFWSILFIMMGTVFPIAIAIWIYELYQVLAGDDTFETYTPRKVKDEILEVEELGSDRHKMMLKLKLRRLRKNDNFKVSNFSEVVELSENGKQYKYVFKVGNSTAVLNRRQSQILRMMSIEGEFYFENGVLQHRNTPGMRTLLSKSRYLDCVKPNEQEGLWV